MFGIDRGAQRTGLVSDSRTAGRGRHGQVKQYMKLTESTRYSGDARSHKFVSQSGVTQRNTWEVRRVVDSLMCNR